MAHQLADETLAAILEALLVVSDKDFACTDRMSPFSMIEQPSSSNYLVVCKRWMRIGTPLLYHTVVMRSQAQATALAAVLKPKANAQFGQYIRKLRIEGGFGVAAKNVLLAARNITDLSVTLNLSAKDNVSPMCDILLTALMPQRLVIAASSPSTNKQITRLTECLTQCIKDWSTLTRLSMSEVLLECVMCLRSAMISSRNLQEITLASQHDSLFTACELAETAFATRVIFPRRLSGVLPYERSRFIALTPAAQAKIIFAPEPEVSRVATTAAVIEAQGNPFFKPLTDVSVSLARSIWTLVLRAALALPRQVLGSQTWLDPEVTPKSRSKNKQPARAIRYMLVCRSWLGIVQIIAAERVATSNPDVLRSFTGYVTSAGHRIETYTLVVYPVYLKHIAERPSLVAALAPPLKRLDGLQQVMATIGISTKIWNTLASTSCFSLTFLEVAVTSGEFNMVCMPVLRTLRITAIASPAKFAARSGCVFPSVTELKVQDYTADAELLQFLASTRLPSLTSLIFDTSKSFQPNLSSHYLDDATSVEPRMTPFLQEHGPSLRSLRNESCSSMPNTILDTCSNLVSWRLRDDWDSYLFPPPPISKYNPSLEVIQIGPIRSSWGAIPSGWLTFFDSLNPETLPALRTVISSQSDLWPTQPREIIKHPTPPIAEALLERGIRLCDSKNVGWKPRLRSRGVKK